MINEKEINNLFKWMIKSLSLCYIYDTWDDAFSRLEMQKRFKQFEEELKKRIDWENLTVEDCNILGFGKWTCQEEVDESCLVVKKMLEQGKITQEDCDKEIEKLQRTANLRLIPLYLYNLIPEGMELIDISGNIVKNDGMLDDDCRMNCLAYGIIPKN